MAMPMAQVTSWALLADRANLESLSTMPCIPPFLEMMLTIPPMPTEKIITDKIPAIAKCNKKVLIYQSIETF